MSNQATPFRLLRALIAPVVLLLASCTTATSQRPPRAVVHFDIAADPLSLDPLFAHADAAVVEQQLAHLCFEPFFDLDAGGNAVPELIDAVPTVRNGGISRDGRTLTYHLRRGVLWSDGVRVSARDVLFTLRAILDPRNPVGSHEGYELIDRAEAPSPLTVRFHLRRAWAPAVATLFSYGTSPQYVLPEHVLAKQAPLAQAPFNAAPSACDGPFVFRSWQRGDRIEYDANPRYWRGRPAIDRLDVRVVVDPSTNLTLLRSGASDFNLIAPSQQRALASVPSLLYRYVPTALIAGIAVNVSHPPLDDPLLRRAIAASIDRSAISAKITLGRYPVTQTDRPRYSWAYDPAIAEPPFDPRAADALFDAAGWRRGPDGVRQKNGVPLALTYVQFPETTTGVRVAAFVQAGLRDRGITANIKSISNAQLFLPAAEGGQLARGAFDLAYVPWQMGADPDDRFLLGCGDALKNYMRYCDATVDALEEQAVREPDQKARRADYARIDAIVARDVPIIYLFNPNYIYAYRSALHGFAPNAFSPTWNAYAWRLAP
jgi:peptide/nickel transport system substrate-binding protein